MNLRAIWYWLVARRAQAALSRSAWGSIGSISFVDSNLVTTKRPLHVNQNVGLSDVGGQKVSVYSTPRIPASLLQNEL